MLLSVARSTASARKNRRSLCYTFCRGLSSASESSSSTTSDEVLLPTNISPIHTSLALSVHFRHPDLGMNDFEILSRATAFLLNVDPPSPEGESAAAEEMSSSSSSTHNSQGHVQKSAYPHLKENRDLRKELLRKQHYSYEGELSMPFLLLCCVVML